MSSLAKRSIGRIFALCILILIVAGITTMTIGVFLQLSENEDLKSDIMLNEANLILLQKELIEKNISAVFSDIKYLAYSLSYQNISSPAAFSQLEDNWKFFSDSKKIYTKIRYIDVSGNEKVKIEYFPNGSVSIKPEELKNKANKSYYKNLSKLLKDQIYISRLELDFDDGTLERQPVIRMSMPVFENGARMGSVVISYNANYLFDDLRNTALTSYGDIYLLNSSGYWLYNDRNGENEWGFMYKGRELLTFANAYPSEWSRIIESGKGNIEDKNGLFTFFDVKPYYKENNYGKTSVLSGEDEWLLASVVSSSSKNGIV
ncbi:MAG: cache domain-containing protein, partial [Bacillota bacterium]|nr:cache domain-containing protein [Bacillota bacterium]